MGFWRCLCIFTTYFFNRVRVMRRANTLNGVFRCLFSWFLLFGRNLFRIVYQGQRIFDIYPHYFPKYMYTRGYRNWILDLNNNTSILFVLNCLWLRWREKVKEQLVLDFFFDELIVFVMAVVRSTASSDYFVLTIFEEREFVILLY